MPSRDEVRIGNGTVELRIPRTYGPRISHYGLTGAGNVFGSGAQARRETPDGLWHAYGGHRLWVAPETFPDTYTLDDRPPEIETGDRRAVVRGGRDPRTRLSKAIDVELDAEGTGVAVTHTIANEGDEPRLVSAWGITVVHEGGVALLPNAVAAPQHEALLPVRALALWRYTDLSDPRFTFGTSFLRLRCDPASPAPNKIGAGIERGWFAYLVAGLAFVVRAPYDPGARYPDYGSSVEVYTEGAFCEVETLGPLRLLQPGERTEHAVRWSLLQVPDDEEQALATCFEGHLDA